MELADETEMLEDLQGSVHRHLPEMGVRAAAAGEKIGRCHSCARRAQDIHHRATRGGVGVSRLGQRVEEVVGACRVKLKKCFIFHEDECSKPARPGQHN